MKPHPVLNSPWTAAAFSAAICAAAYVERDRLTPQLKFCLALMLLVNVPYVFDGLKRRR
jgi:hypothetical protein